mmetsp:Transcript_3723/g.6721  ORF Transcript_3723/g.6721 Transcript_3723/m.6721 type:complete len:91 (+) Transcript_3723:247-519(+)
MMNTLEIEAQCQLTWEKQPFLCCKFFGSVQANPGADEYGVSVGGTSLNFVSKRKSMPMAIVAGMARHPPMPSARLPKSYPTPGNDVSNNH